MSEKHSPWQQPVWPADVPPPGHQAWPDAAVRWLHDHVPANRWRHRHLTAEPWLLCATAAMVVRADLEALRAQYRLTATWDTLLPPGTHRALMAATAREGNRMSMLLDQVVALEEALAPLGQRPASVPGPTQPAPAPIAPGGAR